MRLAAFSFLWLIAGAAPVDRDVAFPFWPFCSSTTTLTIDSTWVATSTSTVTTSTNTVTVTGSPYVSFVTATTTVYSATSISCIRQATTYSAYPAAGNTIKRREPQATSVTATSTGCPTVPPITVIPPTTSGEPCTVLTGDWDVTTETVTISTTGVSTTTITPTTTSTQTQTWIQPTPSSYAGVNYYQYVNDYYYYGTLTGVTAGGYDTADWNGNFSYYTSGLTRNIDFESPDWPTGAALCQLPGQRAATDCSQWTVVFQGFLFAPQAGVYTVHAPIPAETTNWQDNSGFWWGGEKAYSAWDNDNIDGGAISGSLGPTLDNYSNYTLAAGEFLPITFIYNNGGAAAANRIDITSPDGTQYPANLNLFVPPCSNSPFVP